MTRIWYLGGSSQRDVGYLQLSNHATVVWGRLDGSYWCGWWLRQLGRSNRPFVGKYLPTGGQIFARRGQICRARPKGLRDEVLGQSDQTRVRWKALDELESM